MPFFRIIERVLVGHALYLTFRGRWDVGRLGGLDLKRHVVEGGTEERQECLAKAAAPGEAATFPRANTACRLRWAWKSCFYRQTEPNWAVQRPQTHMNFPMCPHFNLLIPSHLYRHRISKADYQVGNTTCVRIRPVQRSLWIWSLAASALGPQQTRGSFREDKELSGLLHGAWAANSYLKIHPFLLWL